jgi:hypothetical protein
LVGKRGKGGGLGNFWPAGRRRRNGGRKALERARMGNGMEARRREKEGDLPLACFPLVIQREKLVIVLGKK